MKIDTKISTELGEVHFKGEVSDEELDYIIQRGLVSMVLTGDLETTFKCEDGTIIQEPPEQLQ